MAGDVDTMDMSFLRECATSHEVVEKRQEMTSALDELEEDDPNCFQGFIQTRFNHFFKEKVTAQMKTMMSVQQWQRMYVRTECLAAVRCYLDWKNVC